MPGLRTWLSEGPGGRSSGALDWGHVGQWLRETYVDSNADKARRHRAKRRHELYISAGDEDMANFVGSVFKDPLVAQKRKEWVERAKFNNVIRRIVNELATVYSVPATRSVKKKGEDQTYQDLQRQCRQHEMMRRINRWANLHRNLAVGFRVREETDGKRRPIIDIVSPDQFFAVSHPMDPTRLIALGLKVGCDGPAKSKDDPEWLVWTDHERFHLNESGYVMTESVVEHGLRRMPWTLLSLEPPAGRLLDDTTGEDLVAAHRAVWFQNILLLKESKSATKQPVIAGDLTQMAREQASDSEVPIELPDQAIVNAVDFSMDLSMFRATAQTIYETAAANYGLAPNLLMHQGVQSAEARELMRAPLKELRREQQIYFREFEREFADIQSMVLMEDMSDLYFSTEGWSIDFGEPSAPIDPKTELEVFEHKRRLGLTDTVEEIMRRNPDLTPKQALDVLEGHIELETIRNELMRPLQQLSGSMAMPVRDPAEPGDDSRNGRDGDDDPRSSEGAEE